MRVLIPSMALVMMWGAGHLLAAVSPQELPCTNNFDQYPGGTKVNTLTSEGWTASADGVVVQSGTVSPVTPNVNAVLLPERTVVSNVLNGGVAASNVWFDSEVVMARDQDQDPPTVNSNAVVLATLGADGYLQLYDRDLGQWRSLSNDIAMAAVSALTNGQWAKVTIHQNYAAHQCAVLLNGRALVDRVPFVSNVNQCATFRMVGAEYVSSYLDDYGMTLAAPGGLAQDANGNGMADGAELQAFGYLGKSFVVGVGQPWTNLQDAVTAALAHDVIAVSNAGPYSVVTLSHDVGGIAGQSFVVNGSFILSAGVSLTSQVGFACDDLTVSNRAMLRVAGSLSAGNVLTGTNATLSVSGALTGGDMNLGTNSVTLVGQTLNGSNLTLNAGASLGVTGGVSVLTMTAGSAASFDVGGGLTCSSLAGSGAVTGSVGGSFSTMGNVILDANSRLVVGGDLSGDSLTLGAGAWMSVAGNQTNSGGVSLDVNSILTVGGVLNGSNVALSAGARLSTAGKLVAGGTVNVSSSSVLTVNGSLSGRNVSVSGGLVLASGGGVTATNLTLGNDVTIQVTNATVSASTLLIATGARLQVVNGTVTADGLTLTGTFTLDSTWGTHVSMPLPFSDDFEQYADGTPLMSLGFRGWAASSGDILVQSATTYGGSSRAVALNYYEMISNRVNGAGASSVWTDFQGIMAYGDWDETPVANPDAVTLVYINPQGYLTIRNNGVWDVCSNDVWQVPVQAITNGQWIHMSVNNDFTRKSSALMLNGRILRDRVPFVNMAATNYSSFRLVNDHINPAYVDNVLIQQNLPSTLSGTDAETLAVYGKAVRGSVFTCR